MNILLISQCSKQALSETRRVLDQFAERKGDRVWQTPITLEGLKTLRKLLKKTARRNTAVACHWVRGKNQTELLWVVGSVRKFNIDGTVPTNVTRTNVLRKEHESAWDSAYSFALLAGIAGMFHDFGKANDLFQCKLHSSSIRREPHRHEWLSFLLFKVFVHGKQDREWLQELASGADVFSNLTASVDYQVGSNFFSNMSPVAQCVAWLIVSHHRLPSFTCYNRGNGSSNRRPELSGLDSWLENFNYEWNSNNLKTLDSNTALNQNCFFSHGLPTGAQWQKKITKLAQWALRSSAFFEQCTLGSPFPLHMARLCLMLSDHCYSASAPTEGWQDPNIQLLANTDRETGNAKQKLDEHLVGVGFNAFSIARRLPSLRQYLPAIARHSCFKKRNKNQKFRWQDKAYDLACGVRHAAEQKGFFGVNMASTGCGKTFANARIIYGLSNPQRGCRMSIALGLRTLTLQTGDALRERLNLDSEDIAVTIGSQQIEELHSAMRDIDKADGINESAEELAEHLYVSYGGALDKGYLADWLKRSPRLHRLVSAPISISTIDHLVTATEGIRGGRQIAPMLRLLTSDLVLDEPDDFGLEDLPALCRLVHWAGLLGSRVLLASATLPPVLIEALFEAYQQGRSHFSGNIDGKSSEVVCAWFDEFRAETVECADRANFTRHHERFVDKRVASLKKKCASLRKARIHALEPSLAQSKFEAVSTVASAIRDEVHTLHDAHFLQAANGKRVSFGVVRMANIKPMVAVAVNLLEQAPEENYRFHFCIYHSQLPLAIRSHIEKRLDATLQRNQSVSVFEQEEVAAALEKYPEKNQVFIVLATPVVEVGRDHDYDWAIAEPSSMRSIIQLAGRVQRHREIEPEQENIVMLSHNIQGVMGENVCFKDPGFESKKVPLPSHDLSKILQEASYKHISAAPRVVKPNFADKQNEFINIEHTALNQFLFTNKNKNASPWWLHMHAHLFGEIQVQQPFRNSKQTCDYFLFVDEGGDTSFQSFDVTSSKYEEDGRIIFGMTLILMNVIRLG
jgi:CRISPR-associated endonuclease/helicase Cas3